VVRGEIYFMDLAPRSGSEQPGRRPCILVSHDVFTSNPAWRSVTVVPLATVGRWRRPSPTTVPLAAGEANLPKACTALAHQVTTLDKSKIVEPAIGRLPETRMKEFEAALANYLRLT
jgi:mRNA-degrading endonuclease toxin of MazEF toxin-antitoxin module